MATIVSSTSAHLKIKKHHPLHLKRMMQVLFYANISHIWRGVVPCALVGGTLLGTVRGGRPCDKGGTADMTVG